MNRDNHMVRLFDRGNKTFLETMERLSDVYKNGKTLRQQIEEYPVDLEDFSRYDIIVPSIENSGDVHDKISSI